MAAEVRERPLMVSAEDEPPARPPRVQLDVKESMPQASTPSLLFSPPAMKEMRLSMPEPQVLHQPTAPRPLGLGPRAPRRATWPWTGRCRSTWQAP